MNVTHSISTRKIESLGLMAEVAESIGLKSFIEKKIGERGDEIGEKFLGLYLYLFYSKELGVNWWKRFCQEVPLSHFLLKDIESENCQWEQALSKIGEYGFQKFFFDFVKEWYAKNQRNLNVIYIQKIKFYIESRKGCGLLKIEQRYNSKNSLHKVEMLCAVDRETELPIYFYVLQDIYKEDKDIKLLFTELYQKIEEGFGKRPLLLLDPELCKEENLRYLWQAGVPCLSKMYSSKLPSKLPRKDGCRELFGREVYLHFVEEGKRREERRKFYLDRAQQESEECRIDIANLKRSQSTGIDARIKRLKYCRYTATEGPVPDEERIEKAVQAVVRYAIVSNDLAVSEKYYALYSQGIGSIEEVFAALQKKRIRLSMASFATKEAREGLTAFLMLCLFALRYAGGRVGNIETFLDSLEDVRLLSVNKLSRIASLSDQAQRRLHNLGWEKFYLDKTYDSNSW